MFPKGLEGYCAPPAESIRYDICVEVNNSKLDVIHHLVSTGWIPFAQGGYTSGSQFDGIDTSNMTTWYGLRVSSNTATPVEYCPICSGAGYYTMGGSFGGGTISVPCECINK